ncbi:MAG: hypothetical protein PVJ67_00075 [Candidatus Pacearchaeota archaeon]
MVNTLNMQDMRHLNLFNKITRVNTRLCSTYNDALLFFVPRRFVSKAIGPEGANIKKINYILRKKVKVIPSPKGVEDAKKFIEAIVSPVTFKDLEVTDEEIILTAGSQSKAALIGRNKRRLIEMQKIVSDFFKRDFRIV